MKKKIALLLAVILYSISALAIPAKPGVHIYRQPDGSVIRLEHHGDEFFSWTTIAGTTQVVQLDKNGYWRRTTLDLKQKKAAAELRKQVNEKRKISPRRSTHNDDPMTHGTRHIPVILVAFSDLDFSIDNPAKQFDDLLNQSGYSAHGATGSVQDFYLDNSEGRFQPIFDVYGPVTLPHNMKYYGEPVKDSNGKILANDRAASEALRDGCRLLDSQIDFSIYDYDNDGEVDMTLFYYAGYNTAEWGPEDAIWPHQSYLGGDNTFDGKRVTRYFCTSELKSNSGVKMCGIGTTCHEFGHSLGLPDFYDTDYDDNGSCSALSYFSPMCSGSYNNDGRTPPYFNAEERIYLGWMAPSDIPELPKGDISFSSIKNGVAYTSSTETEGEYFLYECRDGSGWDSYIPAGMVVYHVDKSPDHIVGGITAYQQWTNWWYYNTINAYGEHPCFYVVPAASQSSLQYDENNLNGWVFPGSKNVSEYVPVDWSGLSNVRLTGITYSGGEVSLTTSYLTEKMLVGTVTDRSGNPVQGAYVVLTPSSGPLPSPSLRKIRKSGPKNSIEAMTDSEGSFKMNVEEFGASSGHITCSREGFHTTGADVSLDKRINVVKLKLDSADQGPIHTYSYYDPSGDVYIFGDKTLDSQACAIRIPASDIPQNGGKLTSIYTRAIWRAQNTYLIVDSGTQRLYTAPITLRTDDYATYDLSSKNLIVPGGNDLYVGIAYDRAQITYADYAGMLFPITLAGNNCYWDELNLEKSNWDVVDEYALVLEASLAEILDDGGDTGPVSLADMGITSIADPGNGAYAAGDLFELKLYLPAGVVVSELSWLFDGQAVDSSVTLQAGQHILKATVSYSDGSEEVFELILSVS